eukprot:817798-Pelagomonas_calceolata.AAC.3
MDACIYAHNNTALVLCVGRLERCRMYKAWGSELAVPKCEAFLSLVNMVSHQNLQFELRPNPLLLPVLCCGACEARTKEEGACHSHMVPCAVWMYKAPS